MANRKRDGEKALSNQLSTANKLLMIILVVAVISIVAVGLFFQTVQLSFNSNSDSASQNSPSFPQGQVGLGIIEPPAEPEGVQNG